MDTTLPGQPAVRIPSVPAIAMTVILLEVPPEVRLDLQPMLAAAGVDLLPASGIAQAIEAADGGDASAILCGITDGGKTLHALASARVRSQPSSPWALVALAGADDGDARIDELHALADDFLRLPLSAGWLRARLHLYARMGEYVGRMQAQRAALKQHQDEAEEERRIASHLISRLVGRDAVAERMMHAWVSPAQQLSGDVVAIARAPDDRINVLLADGTGHGLAAAISVMPVSEVFHRMTDRGFDISSIITEMNRKLRSCMPADRFVACVAASIDMRERVIELWNGGCPPVMLLGSDGSLERVWRSRHMALGILDGRDFDSSVERCSYREPSQLMIVSDGLSEALGQDGKHRFGDRELLEAVRGPATGRRDRVVDHLQAFTGGRVLEDDASLMLVDCLLEPLPEPGDTELMTPSCVSGHAGTSHWMLQMRLGPAQLRQITLLPFVSGLIEQLGIARRRRSSVFCVLSGLLANALDYGLLGMDPAILGLEEGRGRFREERAQRLAKLASGSLWIRAAVEPTREGEFLQIEIEDSGPGFDGGRLESRLSGLGDADAAREGRGLDLVRSICESLRFDQDGRRVVAVIALSTAG